MAGAKRKVNKNGIVLVVSVIVVAAFAGVAVPAVIPAAAAVNSHTALATPSSSSIPVNLTTWMSFSICWFQPNSNCNITYFCQIPWSVQMSWKNSAGVIYIPSDIYLNSTLCHKVSG